MSGTDHTITIEPERDADNLIVWRCTCGEWGTDYTPEDAGENIGLHMDAIWVPAKDPS